MGEETKSEEKTETEKDREALATVVRFSLSRSAEDTQKEPAKQQSAASKLSELAGKLVEKVAEIDRIKVREIDIDAMKEIMRPSAGKIDLDTSIIYSAKLVKPLELLLKETENLESKLLVGMDASIELAGALQKKWAAVYGMEERIHARIESKLEGGESQTGKTRAQEYLANIAERISYFIHTEGKNGKITLQELTYLLLKDYNLEETRYHYVKRQIRKAAVEGNRFVLSVNPYTLWYPAAVPSLFQSRGYTPFTADTYLDKKWVDEKFATKKKASISLAELQSHTLRQSDERIPTNSLIKMAVTDKGFERYAKFMFDIEVDYDRKSKHFKIGGYAQFH